MGIHLCALQMERLTDRFSSLEIQGRQLTRNQGKFLHQLLEMVAKYRLQVFGWPLERVI